MWAKWVKTRFSVHLSIYDLWPTRSSGVELCYLWSFRSNYFKYDIIGTPTSPNAYLAGFNMITREPEKVEGTWLVAFHEPLKFLPKPTKSVGEVQKHRYWWELAPAGSWSLVKIFVTRPTSPYIGKKQVAPYKSRLREILWNTLSNAERCRRDLSDMRFPLYILRGGSDHFYGFCGSNEPKTGL